MIQVNSLLEVADNSGAKRVKCISIPGVSKKKYAYVGDTISVSVKGALPHGAIKDHQIAQAVIVRTKKEQRRKDGTYIRFDDNAVVLVDKTGQPMGTRVFGPIAKEVKDQGFNKVASLAKEVL
jgi:large subunit ribosomal protein L14